MINNINISKKKNNIHTEESIYEQNYTTNDGDIYRYNDCQSYQDINQDKDKRMEHVSHIKYDQFEMTIFFFSWSNFRCMW